MKKWIQRHAQTYHRSTDSMKQFYERIHGLYWFVEKYMGHCLTDVMSELSARIPLSGRLTALEYCCGSGLLTIELSQYFEAVTARDLSPKMLARAQKRTARKSNISFSEGNVLHIDDPDSCADYAFISFGLHLFSPTDRKEILRQLLRTARKEVIIIEHLPKVELLVALAEWLEGSHYFDFVNTEWRKVADELNAHVDRDIICKMQVQRWRLNSSR
ncbi:MAG: class I SAM-dependent methyltransferase [Deltaproteobacteria bacterium]|nr:class I SAM-dependent methyltransferase [Deltaproteobacteria bacterium]MBN2670729.1 class I SAM-dependent methyltransferase [Deltaproteobacteria bacterium]